MNWKVRFQNKVWLVTFLAAAVGFLYQGLGALGVVPPVSENTVLELLSTAVNLLALLGIVVDPTTAGVGDSARALTYQTPGGEEDEQ